MLRRDEIAEVNKQLAEKSAEFDRNFKTKFVLSIYNNCMRSRNELARINNRLQEFVVANSRYSFVANFKNDGSIYDKIIRYGKIISRKSLTGNTNQTSIDNVVDEKSLEEELKLEKEIRDYLNVCTTNDLTILSDYLNYLSCGFWRETVGTGSSVNMREQMGNASVGEMQIPYIMMLVCGLLVCYDAANNGSARFIVMDEAFKALDDANIRAVMRFIKSLDLQLILCAPSKVDSIGAECDTVVLVHRKDERSGAFVSDVVFSQKEDSDDNS